MYYEDRAEYPTEPITPDWQAFAEAPRLIGADDAQPLCGMPAVGSLSTITASPGVQTAWRIASILGAAAGAYHGYKRVPDHKVLGAIWYGILGSVVPVIAVPVMIAQGYGKQK